MVVTRTTAGGDRRDQEEKNQCAKVTIELDQGRVPSLENHPLLQEMRAQMEALRRKNEEIRQDYQRLHSERE